MIQCSALNICYSDVWAISVSIYNCSKLKIGSSRVAGCSCCLQLRTLSEFYLVIYYLQAFLLLPFFSLESFSSRSDSFGKLQFPDSWWFVRSEILRIYGVPGHRYSYGFVSTTGLCYTKKNPSTGAALLTQNKKLKKKRKYLIQGLTKEKVSARFRFCFLSIVCWCCYSHIELQYFENSPQTEPHPADTQPPCESVKEGVVCRLWGGGVTLAKKRGHRAVTLLRHAGRAQKCLCRQAGQITQKISLADCSWMAYEL